MTENLRPADRPEDIRALLDVSVPNEVDDDVDHPGHDSALALRISAGAVLVGLVILAVVDVSPWGMVLSIVIGVPAFYLFAACADLVSRGGRLR